MHSRERGRVDGGWGYEPQRLLARASFGSPHFGLLGRLNLPNLAFEPGAPQVQ